MKRFLLLIVLVMVVSSIVASHRSPSRRIAEPHGRWIAAHRVHDGDARNRSARDEVRKARRVLAEARDEVRKSLDVAGEEIREAFDEARDEVHEAFHELRVALVSDDVPSDAMAPAPSAREDAEGLPVRIVPGTRVTEAKASPPTPRTSAISAPAAISTLSPHTTVTGRLSATKERAVNDARRALRDNITSWLDPEVPRSWTAPARALDGMVMGEPRIKLVEKEYGDVFEATLIVDTSPQRRAALIETYNRQLIAQRLTSLGATLAFVLVCLAAVSGYIRADEASKGYYTNRLRVLTAAGVGASGVILYHMVV